MHVVMIVLFRQIWLNTTMNLPQQTREKSSEVVSRRRGFWAQEGVLYWSRCAPEPRERERESWSLSWCSFSARSPSDCLAHATVTSAGWLRLPLRGSYREGQATGAVAWCYHLHAYWNSSVAQDWSLLGVTEPCGIGSVPWW